MVVSDNGKEIVYRGLKEWLKVLDCYKPDTPILSPSVSCPAERAIQTLKRSLNFFRENLRCSLETYIVKILFSHANSSNS